MPDTTDATARAAKLTKPEMARLVEIEGWWRKHRTHPSCGHQPKVTASLIAKGLVVARGGKIAKTGRIMHHADAALTDLGAGILAGLPAARP